MACGQCGNRLNPTEMKTVDYLRDKLGPGTPKHIMGSIGYEGSEKQFEEGILTRLVEVGAIERDGEVGSSDVFYTYIDRYA